MLQLCFKLEGARRDYTKCLLQNMTSSFEYIQWVINIFHSRSVLFPIAVLYGCNQWPWHSAAFTGGVQLRRRTEGGDRRRWVKALRSKFINLVRGWGASSSVVCCSFTGFWPLNCLCKRRLGLPGSDLESAVAVNKMQGLLSDRRCSRGIWFTVTWLATCLLSAGAAKQLDG